MDEKDNTTNNKTFGNITIKIKKKKDDGMKNNEISKIKDILDKTSGEYTIEAEVRKIIQTRGPTIFQMADGTGTLDIAGFISPGARAYPDISEKDSIRATITIEMREDKKRIVIKELSKIESISSKIEEMAFGKDPENSSLKFTIQSKVLDDLCGKFRSARALIKKSIGEGRSIQIRHHADMDGYAGALALEKAIMPIIEAMFGDRDKWHHFDRAPSPTPFYEYSDVLRDLSFAKKGIERFKNLEPLVILVDNGSTEEDLLSIRKAKIYNIPLIVIDHHFTEVENGKSVVDDYVDVHINPYLVGGTKDITAGMLAYELSRIINKDAEDLKILPALAGIADRSKGPELEQYIKNSGKDRDRLKKIAQCVDYEAHYLRFIQDAGLIYDLISDDEKHIALIDLLFADIEEKIRIQKDVLTRYAKEETLKNNILLATIDITGTTQRGDYPSPGRAVGILNDSINARYPDIPIVTLGHGPDFITLRANSACEKKGLNLNHIVTMLINEMPHGMVSGGGHEVAGTAKFVEVAKEEVMQKVIRYVEEL